MASICTGDEFEVDEDGRLKLRICGDPAEVAWPYPCPVATNNPVRVGPDCGLYVPAGAKAATAFMSGSTTAGGGSDPIPVAFTTIDSADITIPNPSACYPADVVIRWVSIDVDLTLPPGTSARGAVRAFGNNEILIYENSAPAAGTTQDDIHWETVLTSTVGGPIPAGGSLPFTCTIEVGRGAGGAQWNEVRWQVRTLALAGLT